MSEAHRLADAPSALDDAALIARGWQRAPFHSGWYASPQSGASFFWRDAYGLAYADRKARRS